MTGARATARSWASLLVAFLLAASMWAILALAAYGAFRLASG